MEYVTPLLNSAELPLEFCYAAYLLTHPENLQCRFIGVTEEHVAKIQQCLIILCLHQIRLSACRDLKLWFDVTINDHIKNELMTIAGYVALLSF